MFRGAAVALLLLGLAVGCQRGAPPPNVLVILADTLRSDRLGAYGNSRQLSPFIDSLAQRGYVFRNAYAQTPWTNPSVASLFTSRYQSQHGIVTFASVLADHELTLAEVLRERGYATAGFNANYLLPPKTGFGQGFEVYRTLAVPKADAHGHDKFAKPRAERVNSEAFAWLDQPRRAGQPFFLYLHYMEAHNPYTPEAEFLARVLGGRPAPDQGAVNTRMNMPNVGVFPDDMVQAVKDYYDAEVISLDRQLRALFDGLAARHLLDNTVVVFLADHGEEFREHELMGHGQTLFEEVIHVPLIIVLPGQTQRADVAGLASVVDVAPTLLDLAGIAAPSTFEGHSLRARMGLPARGWSLFGSSQATDVAVPAAIYSELIKNDLDRLSVHQRAVRTDDGKLITGVGGEQEFYDLKGDPAETNAAALDEVARARLAGELARFTAHVSQGSAPAATRPLDNDTRERMRALGYDE